MKYKKSKFLLIGLLVLSIIISVSAINATDDTSTNTMKTAKDDPSTINIQNNNNNTTTKSY